MHRIEEVKRALLLAAAGLSAYAQTTLSLSSSVPSPAPLGTLITWTAAAPEPAFYRFRVSEEGQPPRTVVDFGPNRAFDWAPYDREGHYVIEVAALNRITGEITTAEAPFEVLSNVTAGVAVIRPTSHPLVFLYSAPPCSSAAVTYVTFTGPGGQSAKTPEKPCDEAHSVNFLLAGLHAETTYAASHTLTDGDRSIEGEPLTFTSGEIPDNLSVHTAAGASGSPAQGIMLAGSLNNRFIATDLDGAPIWYYPGEMQFLTHPEPGGYFFGVHQVRGAGESSQILRMWDLTGVTVLETNAARVNDQLEAMGKTRVGAFHHDARFLSDGKIIILASVERLLDDVQGAGAVDVVGDALVVLDPDLNVVWYWDSFDHLDVKRLATLGEPCNPAACPPLFLAAEANDWTHGNAVAETPDGNLILSLRHQDWVIKIDYAGGAGSGTVLWRLGPGGDFRIEGGSEDDWFSHQHDPEFEADGALTIFDNGNLRRDRDPVALSRGQAWELDETNHTAKLVFNSTLGVYSAAVGSAQLLENGNYFFDCGFLSDGSAISVELNPQGVPTHSLRSTAPEYRTFRMRDMYTP
ncbi:MAG: aryl-sulfate sulfotransferase [Bryobacteraceae bacterium]